MRQSHIKTPRTLADCEFRVGYTEANPARTLDQIGETVVAYTLAFAAGFVLAVMVFA
jgi:hypothetical protein